MTDSLAVPAGGQQTGVDPAEAFRLIADFTHDWEMWHSPARELLYVSPSCERISGYPPAAFLADPGLLTAIVHPADRAAFAHHLELELHHPAPLALEFRIVTRAGEERWLHHVCQPVHGTDGRSLGRRASNRDVTDQHVAQAAKDRALGELRTSEARFRRRSAELESLHAVSLQLNAQMDTASLLQQILDQAIALLDVEAGLFFLHDPERAELIGEIANEYLAEFVGTRLARGQGLAWEVFESRRARTIVDYDRWPQRVPLQAQRPLLRYLLAVPLIGKDGVLGVLDLGSERREFGEHDVWLAELFAAQAAVALEGARLLARVEHQARELARVEKMAALGRMAAALAHEVNNPLQAIQSHVELVLDFALPPEQQAEFLGVVRSEMARLTAIVQRVLDFARPALAPRRAVAVDEVIRQTLALASKQLQRSNIRVTADLAPDLVVAVGLDQIVQVFLNLVINAVDAIGRDGAIEIRAVGDGDRAAITVANDGPAIAQRDLPHVFEPFYTTKADGTGLGLAVSQNLVAQYGGQIAVANQDGDRGVVFTVHLPLASTEPTSR